MQQKSHSRTFSLFSCPTNCRIVSTHRAAKKDTSNGMIILSLYTMNAAEINNRWRVLQKYTASHFDTDTPDIKILLFLIGVQELGKGPMTFSKRQKEELMHIATCRLFSGMGFYELEGLDQDGWPHWRLIKPIPNYTLLEQEMILKSLIIDYFEEQIPNSTTL